MRRSWGLELAFDLRITVQRGAGLAFNGYTFVFDIRGLDSAPSSCIIRRCFTSACFLRMYTTAQYIGYRVHS